MLSGLLAIPAKLLTLEKSSKQSPEQKAVELHCQSVELHAILFHEI